MILVYSTDVKTQISFTQTPEAPEFIYLFEKVHDCAIGEITTSYDHDYQFGNNLRKFLEAFLFFKYPLIRNDENENKERIKRFFGNDPLTSILSTRISNELSHLEGAIERGMQPIDSAELKKLAQFVVRKLHENDKEQLNELLGSIQQPEYRDASYI